MTKILEIINWKGAVQKIAPRRLADGLGVDCSNLWRGYADLRGLPSALEVVTDIGSESMQTAWRMGRDAPSDTEYWLLWPDDVDIVRAFNANDPNEEIHYTGDGIPKTTTTALALPSTPQPAAWRALGVPKPSAAMSATLNTAGGGDDEVRVYVDTFQTDTNRESAPGTPVTVTVAGGSTVDLNGFAAVPSGSYGINARKIYVSTDGGPFQLCLSLSDVATSGTDTGTRGDILQSGGDTSKPAWEAPPDDLTGLIELWNSMLGGFTGKEFRICEPGKAWAWPVEYGDTLPDTIVGTGVWLQNWVVLTTAKPYIVRGSGPLNMTWEGIEFNHACVSKRSVISLGHGVAWASPRGLCYIGQNGTAMLTEGLFSQAQWDALVPSTMHCAQWEDMLIVFFDDDGASGHTGFMIDPLQPANGFIFIDECACGTYRDPISDRLYLLCCGIPVEEPEEPELPSYTALLPTGVPITREVFRISFDELTYGMDIALDPARTGAAAVGEEGSSATAQLWRLHTGVGQGTMVIAAGDILPSYTGMGHLIINFSNGGVVEFFLQFPIDKTPYAFGPGDTRSRQFVQAVRMIYSGQLRFEFLKDGVGAGATTLQPLNGFQISIWYQPEALQNNAGLTDADIFKFETSGLGVQEYTIGEIEVEIGTWPDLSGTGTVSVGGGTGVITGAVGRDLTGNGVPNVAIFGVEVLLKSGPTTLATTNTSAAGLYRFENVPPGTYTVQAVDPPSSPGISADTASVTSASDTKVANFVKETAAIRIWDGERYDSSPNDYRVEFVAAAERTDNGAIRLGNFRGDPNENVGAVAVASGSLSASMTKLTAHFWYQIKRRVNGEKRWMVVHSQELSADNSAHPFAFFVAADATYGASVCNAAGVATTITTTVDAVECVQVHHALVVDGDAVRYYIDGVLEGSAAISPSGSGLYQTASHVVVGAWSANHASSIIKGVEGWLGGLSVTPSHALYSGASFTPPACPVTAEACTVVTALPGAGAASAAAIATAAQAWWEFQEDTTDSVFADSVASNDLNVRNASGLQQTTFMANGIGNPGRYFNPNSVEGVTAYLPSTFKKANSSFSYGGWIKTRAFTSGSARFLMGDIGSSATDFQTYIYLEGGDDKLYARFSTDGSLAGSVAVGGVDGPSSSAWMLVIATLDRENNQIEIRSRAVGDASTTKVTAAFAGALYTGSSTSNWNLNDGISNGTTYFSGDRAGLSQAMQAFILDDVVTDEMFEYMFNSGDAKSLAEIQADAAG